MQFSIIVKIHNKGTTIFNMCHLDVCKQNKKPFIICDFILSLEVVLYIQQTSLSTIFQLYRHA
jgi:hypothetical protein